MAVGGAKICNTAIYAERRPTPRPIVLTRLRLRLKRFDVIVRSFRPVRLKYPAFGDLDALCAEYVAGRAGRGPTTTLDLGCGPAPRNPFGAATVCGIDIREHPERNVRTADLAVEQIPHADASFDYVTAYDFIEHVPRVLYAPARRFPFVELMNEIYRVLKPDGAFLSFTPAYPFATAFQDPTHVNVITEDTFPLYFDAIHAHARMYGFRGGFSIVRQGWQKRHLVTLLAKATPA